MKKEWFFDRYCNQQFAAFVEDGKLTEFSIEQENSGEIVGNIYKGKVANVLTGMNAAFLSCGLAKNCYLSMEESYTDYTKYDGTLVSTGAKPLDLKAGDELIVQMTKPPRGNKGAKVTTHISFVGKCLIYLPQTDFLGISRKITDETEREKLLKIVDKMRTKQNEGFIVRTQAPFATLKQLKAEAAYLKNQYAQMLVRAKDSPVGTVLYQDETLPMRMMRDTFGEDISAIHVGDKQLYDELKEIVRMRKDLSERKLIFYDGERSMMEEYGIAPLVYATASPIVPLETGGYIVIEHTEAMTVVDVNTGSYIGTDCLEETVFAVNMAAAKEIARQIRLRNVGGIVVIDFIDMVEETHRLAVNEALGVLLAQDKAKCHLLPMNEFCVSQFTRKRVGNDMQSFLVKPCSCCEGKGHVPDDIFVIIRIRANILDCFADGYSSAIIELNAHIMRKILEEGFFRVEAGARWKNKRIYFIPHKTYREDQFTVRGENADVLVLPDNAQILY